MELLPQDAYTGPPPRFAVGATVYYQGHPYTVARVLGRAPVVGWAYELDGPAELIQVGEGELSDYAPMRYQVTERIAGQLPRSYALTIDTRALLQAAAEFEQAVVTMQAITGQPHTVCRRVAERYPFGLGTVLDGLRAGYMIVTPDSDLATRPGYWIAADGPTDPPPILASTDPRPQPRLNRAARRAKHRPWTPPAVKNP